MLCFVSNKNLVKRIERCIISQFHVIEVVFKDEPMLVQSLKEMGYKPAVHKTPVVVGGSYNAKKVKANVIVSKGQFNGSYGDVGFEKTAKGFVMHADHIDIRKFNLKGLNKKYAENKLMKYVNQTSKCNVFSRAENDKNQVEIQLRIQQ